MKKISLIIVTLVFGFGLQSCSKHTYAQAESKPRYYTCPMHNDIIEMKPGTCPKCGMNLEEFDIEERIRMNTSGGSNSHGSNSNSGGGHSGGCH